jgi:hypothetical protein
MHSPATKRRDFLLNAAQSQNSLLAVIVPAERSVRLDAPERICSYFFQMLSDHIDPSACKFRKDG